MILVVLMTVLAFSAFAVEPPPPPVVTPAPSSAVTAEGTANQAVIRNYGDNWIGGFGAGDSAGQFSALKDCDIFGVANANGVATGFGGVIDANTAAATSKGVVNSDALTNGSTVTLLKISGFSEEGNWANVGDTSSNFAGGSGYTSGTYDGAFTGVNLPGGASGSGASESLGNTNVSISQAPDGLSKHAEAVTQGSSTSTLNSISGPTSVTGNGSVGVQSILGAPTQPSFAAASGTGSATFAGNGVNTIAGSLNVAGVTNTIVTPTSVSASSQVNSQATVTPCGGTCVSKP